jgi:hypothetical protein
MRLVRLILESPLGDIVLRAQRLLGRGGARRVAKGVAYDEQTLA